LKLQYKGDTLKAVRIAEVESTSY